MRRLLALALLVAPAVLVRPLAIDDQISAAGEAPDAGRVVADVVATGIAGAGAITQIGTYHQGGPLHDNPALIGGSTDPGQVLDRTRLFVASTSNFGAPIAIDGQAEGSILSIDVSGGRVDVPAGFATSTTVGCSATSVCGCRCGLSVSARRTAPLWRVSDRVHFLHDGRAATIRDAILLHGGQASGAVAVFNALSERQALLAFSNCI